MEYVDCWVSVYRRSIKNEPFLNFAPDLNRHFIEKDKMKYICGYEDDLPDFIYGEEASYLKEMGDSTPSCFHCIQCHKDILYRKGIRFPN